MKHNVVRSILAILLAAFWLAGFLWIREYRGQHLHSRQAGHAW